MGQAYANREIPCIPFLALELDDDLIAGTRAILQQGASAIPIRFVGFDVFFYSATRN